jgi:predicted alternative tryptophan synthase beta-subunit
MTQKITKSDFIFQFAGYGHYRVSYQSPITGKKWINVIDDMTIIDKTKNEETPKIKDLETLKKIVKKKFWYN